MPANLLPCLTGQEPAFAYCFKETGVNVYSFEEALYYAFHNWKQAAEDCLSADFTRWVNQGLGLSFLASEIKAVSETGTLAERIVRFLSLIPYFEEDELLALKGRVQNWENRHEWEKYKERGDYLYQDGQYQKAAVSYRKALANDDTNAALLNNLGLCLLRLNQYAESAAHLLKAYSLAKTDTRILFHLIESLVYGGCFAQAEQYLAEIPPFHGHEALVSYFRGEICFHQEDLAGATVHYEKAVALAEDTHSIFRLTDICCKLRQFDKALAMLQKFNTDAPAFLVKQAGVYKDCHNIPAAIACMEKALSAEPRSAQLWALLAMYYRMDYNLEKAEDAIRKAVSLRRDADFVNLEYARVKKAQGKMKEYQTGLRRILNGYKRSYRELYDTF